MTNVDSILKSRDITLPTKVHLVKAMVYPLVMYGCESWTIKKAECWRIYAFERWYWRKLLRVPWTARRSNQSILKETSPGCLVEGLMLKLKLQYWPPDGEELTHLKRPWCWEGLGQEVKGMTEDEMAGWHHRLDGHEFEWTPWVGDGQGGLVCCGSWGRKEWNRTERLNWTDTVYLYHSLLSTIHHLKEVWDLWQHTFIPFSWLFLYCCYVFHQYMCHRNKNVLFYFCFKPSDCPLKRCK